MSKLCRMCLGTLALRAVLLGGCAGDSSEKPAETDPDTGAVSSSPAQEEPEGVRLRRPAEAKCRPLFWNAGRCAAGPEKDRKRGGSPGTCPAQRREAAAGPKVKYRLDFLLAFI